jgi:hypothetical protein
MLRARHSPVQALYGQLISVTCWSAVNFFETQEPREMRVKSTLRARMAQGALQY